MKQLFRELTKKYNPHQIFNDFLEMTALSISNSVDLKNHIIRESRYIEISRKYSNKELDIFTNILGELVIKLEKSPKDILGDVLMELEEGNKIKGQYFTPLHVCLLNATLAFNEKQLNKDGHLIVSEPSCGGGALIIALYKIMKDKGYNPQEQLKVIAKDLDFKSVLMCYIQLSLLGIPAKVVHTNTLNDETFSIWKTPEWILGGWEYKKTRKEDLKEVNK